MKIKLIQHGLWEQEEQGDPGSSVSKAWSVLSRLGYPGRYAGKTQDGYYEFAIADTETGALMISGKGDTLPMAMCEAALAARVRELN